MHQKNKDRTVPHTVMLAAAYLTIIGVGFTLVQDMIAGSLQDGTGSVFSAFNLRIGAVIISALAFALLFPSPPSPLSRKATLLIPALAAEILIGVLLFALTAPSWLPAVLYLALIPVGIHLPMRFRFSFYTAVLLAAAGGILSGGKGSNRLPTAVSIMAAFIADIAFTERLLVLRESSERTRRLMDSLVEAQTRLKELTVTEERHRLAQEMHDAVGHRLSVAAVQLEAVSRLIESDQREAKRLAELSRGQVREALRELRSAVGSLRSSVVPGSPLSEAIEKTAAAFSEGFGVQVSSKIDPEVDTLDEERATAVLRCVQEGLTNVRRHTRAEKVLIEAGFQSAENGQTLVVNIRDSGKDETAQTGFSSKTGESGSASVPLSFPIKSVNAEGGFGLESLSRRAERFGGSLTLTRNPSGACLSMEIPVEHI